MNKEAMEKIKHLLGNRWINDASDAEGAARDIHALYVSLGYVQLNKDQSLPENPCTDRDCLCDECKTKHNACITYNQAQQDMLTPKDGTVWAKIIVRKVKK